MEPGEYDGLVAKAQAGGTGAAIDLLSAMRTNKIHQPELVIIHGGKLLSSAPRKLGGEIWAVLEQVFLAAVDVGADDWRDYSLSKLTKRFPSSNRVERLKGINEESKRNWAEAQKIYKKMLAEKPEDTVTRKRQIAVFKQQGNREQAVIEINQYLEHFCTDTEVWHELAELYVEVGSLSRAVYCYEELMLTNPRSMYHILTYAELLFSTGDYDLSRKYFSLASYLDGTCLRAIWGLLAVNMALADKDKSNERMGQLQGFTIDRLKAQYKGLGSHGKVAIDLLNSGL